METIKVLHSGDCHLGRFEGRLTEKQKERNGEYFQTFQNIILMCLSENVEILLLAGDLFDKDQPDQRLVQNIIREFQKIPDTVIMISPGNHDYYRPNSYYDKISTECENVFIFDGKMDYYELKIQDKDVRVYGAGFTKPVQTESLMEYRQVQGDQVITLGVFHGEIVSERQESYYNPITLDRIRRNAFDYLALGHIHKQTDVLTVGMSNYAFCGCPEGFGYGEQGIKGVYLGEVGHGFQNMQYVRTCKRLYLNFSLNLGTMNLHSLGLEQENNAGMTAVQVADVISQQLRNQYGEDYKNNYYRIHITGTEAIDLQEVERNLSHIYEIELDYQLECHHIDTQENQKHTLENESGHFILHEIHIGNFGGLKNVQMNFTNGFQMIYGPNEFGKTTIMAFVKMMLYGCNSKSRDLSVNLRKRYQPFDKSLMHGSLTFSINNRQYLVEKEFGKSTAYDVRRVTDINSGKEIVLPKEIEVGDYFLKINADEFDKTMFAAAEDGFVAMDGQQTLIRRIANLSKGLPETDERPEKIASLTKQMDTLQSKRGTSGKIPEITQKIEQYKIDVNRYEVEKRNLQEQRKSDLSTVKKEYKVVSSLIDKLETLDSGELNGDIPSHYKHENKKLKKDKRNTISLMVLFSMIAVAAAAGGILVHPYFYAGTGFAAVLVLIYKIKLNGLNCIYPYESKAQVGLREKTEILMEELGYEDASIEDLRERLDELEEIMEDGDSEVLNKTEKQIRHCREQIQNLNHTRVELTQQYEKLRNEVHQLEQSLENTGEGIPVELNKRALTLLNQMMQHFKTKDSTTQNTVEEFMIGPDYTIRIKRKGNAYYEEWETLSTATASQAYLALRISLCEMLGDGKVAFPMLLDDILATYDDQRFAATINVLKSLDTQVILFTCHGERHEERNGAYYV